MGKFRAFLDTLNSLTGISARHNRALRDVRDWTATVQRFLAVYNLYGRPAFDSLFKNAGEAKVDLIAIGYKARPLIEKAKNIKGKQVSPLVAALTENAENLRRALSSPSLRYTTARKAIPGFLRSFEELQDALSDIEYL